MPFRFFSFSVLIAAGALLGHLYLYRRLTRDLVRSRALRLLALAALILLMFRRTLQRSLPEELAAAVAMTSYAWMGLALFLVIALLVVDLEQYMTVGGTALLFRTNLD